MLNFCGVTVRAFSAAKLIFHYTKRAMDGGSQGRSDIVNKKFPSLIETER